METKKKTGFKPGEHPNSLANLIHEGRPKAYGTDKKQRYLSITEEGWNGAKDIAQMLDCTGVSDLIEKLGRGELKVISSQ
jgi:hypothetical protein